jgi:hypothetical protein
VALLSFSACPIFLDFLLFFHIGLGEPFPPLFCEEREVKGKGIFECLFQFSAG